MYEALDATVGETEWFERADSYGKDGVMESFGFEVAVVEEVCPRSMVGA